MRSRILGPLIIVAALIGGCQRADDGGISEERFIDVVVALRKAALQLEDPAGFAAQKAQILSEAAVTEDQLRAYIDTHQHDLSHMAAVWESINVRLADPANM